MSHLSTKSLTGLCLLKLCTQYFYLLERFDFQSRKFMLSTVIFFKLMTAILVKQSNIYIMYSSEYQIMTYFSVMLCQNRCPEKCPREKKKPGKMPPRTKPPKKIAPGKMPPRKLPPGKLFH